MKKLDARIVLGLAVLAIIIGGTLVLDINSGADDYIVSGYDGIVGEITEVDQGANGGTLDNDGTKAILDPPEYWTAPLGGRINPTKVICEIDAAVDVLKNETVHVFDKWVNTTNYDGSIIYQHVEVNEYSCLMGVTLMTDFNGGLEVVQNIVYTIKLSENDFSIFADANETYASIVQVWMRTPATVVGIGSVTPASGGYAFPMTTVGTEEPPIWLSQVGYNVNNMKRLHEVEISFTLNSIQPTYTGILKWWPVNSQISFLIGIDVVLAGEWVRTTFHGWEPPPPPPGPFDWLFNGLYAFGAALTNGLAAIGWSTIWPIAIIVVVLLVVYMTVFRRRG